MASKISISLLSEGQTGTIGNDWKYILEAKVFGIGADHSRIDKGSIKVAKHNLDSGKTQAPPGPPEPLMLAAGNPGDPIQLDLRLKVEEVDLLRNDTAEKSVSIKMTCPAAGQPPVVEDRDLEVRVVEEPSGVGYADFKLSYKVTLESA